MSDTLDSTSASESIVAFQEVTKSYRSGDAVTSLTFTVHAGERVVILGDNGAGKTTILRLLLGLARPTSGSICLFGGAPSWPSREGVLRQIGYSPQAPSLPGPLRVREIIRLVAELKGVPEPVDLYASLGIEPILPAEADSLSLGQARLVATSLAFVGSPPFVLLDEPTAGLDVSHRYSVWRHTADYCQAGGTLLLASHDFAEVSQLAERVIFLRNGELIEDGPMTEVLAMTGVSAIEVGSGDPDSVPGALRILRTPRATVVLTRDPALVRRSLLLSGAAAGSLVHRQATSEEVFLAIGGAG